MATKANRSLSDENLEKASGGKVIKQKHKKKIAGGLLGSAKYDTFTVFDDKDGSYVGTVMNEKEAQGLDMRINGPKNKE